MMFGWILIFGLVFYFLYSRDHHNSNLLHDNGQDAMAILRERYAKGEINREEFLDRKNQLESQ